ncbi:MAG: hypothetical protein ACRDOO_24175 [Actinomadura sp.]
MPDARSDADLPELADLTVDMKRLAEPAAGAPAELTAALLPLVHGYRNWIERRQATLGEAGRQLSGYAQESADTLRSARRAGNRIERGIRLLEQDGAAKCNGHVTDLVVLMRPDGTRGLIVPRVTTPTRHPWRTEISRACSRI